MACHNLEKTHKVAQEVKIPQGNYAVLAYESRKLGECSTVSRNFSGHWEIFRRSIVQCSHSYAITQRTLAVT